MSLDDMRNKNTTSLPLQEWREETGSLNLTLTVVSVAPRIIQIDGFLSDVEVDHILSLAQEKNMARSTTGMSGKEAHVSTVRTSRTTWLPRHSSPIMNAIIRRGADVLKIDEALLRRRLDDEEFPDIPSNNAINEDLQIVHYGKGQQYTAHHE
jgi:prolyl 4-hydroxylase